MDITNPILKSVKPVIKELKFVKINKKNLLKFCSNFELKKKPVWSDSTSFKFQRLRDEEELNFLLKRSKTRY